jgi:hypothetical protein
VPRKKYKQGAVKDESKVQVQCATTFLASLLAS